MNEAEYELMVLNFCGSVESRYFLKDWEKEMKTVETIKFEEETKREFTEKELCIIDVLSDGDRHKRDEIKDALKQRCNYVPDTLRDVLRHIRPKLQSIGLNLIVELHLSSIHYRLTRRIRIE